MTIPPTIDELPPEDPEEVPVTVITSIARSPEEEVDLLTQLNINLESIADTLTVMTVKLERIAQALEKSPQPAVQGGGGKVVPWRTGPQQAGATVDEESFPTWECPIHGTFKIVPAGTSKKTGKPYAAFMVCGERGCDERPPRES